MPGPEPRRPCRRHRRPSRTATSRRPCTHARGPAPRRRRRRPVPPLSRRKARWPRSWPRARSHPVATPRRVRVRPAHHALGHRKGFRPVTRAGAPDRGAELREHTIKTGAGPAPADAPSAEGGRAGTASTTSIRGAGTAVRSSAAPPSAANSTASTSASLTTRWAAREQRLHVVRGGGAPESPGLVATCEDGVRLPGRGEDRGHGLLAPGPVDGPVVHVEAHDRPVVRGRHGSRRARARGEREGDAGEVHDPHPRDVDPLEGRGSQAVHGGRRRRRGRGP